MPTASSTRAISDCAGIDLEQVDISKGSHGSKFTGDCCIVEWSNRAAVCVPELRERFGDPGYFSDDHPSISRAIRSFCIGFNDGLPDDAMRNRLLRPYITLILGTRTTDADETTRAWLATDWLVRVHAPAFLDLAGLTEDASKLRNLTPLTSSEIAIAAQQTITGARERASAAGDAARAAARAAAWDAAGDAARAAARAAAWDAARAAAGDAARAAAGDAARAAAGDAARAAAWAAAGAAARDAARQRLAPTVSALQASAIELLDRMIAVGRSDA